MRERSVKPARVKKLYGSARRSEAPPFAVSLHAAARFHIAPLHAPGLLNRPRIRITGAGHPMIDILLLGLGLGFFGLMAAYLSACERI
jgi:hypothetical protein